MPDGLELDLDPGVAAVQSALKSHAGPDGRVSIDPETIEQDLARLVLGLIEFIRQLMELQAIRRSEAGTLSPEEEERLGLALMRSEHAVRDIAAKFGLSADDLSLDLGPLGRTV